MAIKFFNIRTRETRVAETEPLISALWASSDHSPNITQGQDFGWRLAPEVVIELKRIARDANSLKEIAVIYNLPLEAVGEKEILTYISSKIDAENAPVAEIGDYQDEYDAEVRRLERLENEPTKEATVTTMTTESLADMERRAELAERIARANAAPTTTTTTTVKEPKATTTTTTKVK